MTLHMDLTETRYLQSQMAASLADLQNALQGLAHVRFQLDAWSGLGKDNFTDWYDSVRARVGCAVEETADLYQALTAEMNQWIEVDQQGAARFAAIAMTAGSALTIGAPAYLSRYVQKQQGNTCALYAQGTAMQALTGQPFDIDEARKLGLKAGYVNILGFETIVGVGKLWEAKGIAFEEFYRGGLLPADLRLDADADFRDAASFLIENIEANHAVIVGLEADVLYDGMYGQQDNYWMDKGHSVWVTGLRTDAAGQVTEVLLNDSGLGQATAVPVAQFMRAWRVRNYQAVASIEPLKVG